MPFFWKAPLILALGFAATFMSARLARRVVANEALEAATYCIVLGVIVTTATFLYVNDLKTAPFLVLGNGIGTYISVRTDRRGR
ncbi:MAG TPA: hypothetical protein VF787_03445 [Thermoanaerobaculia bacterium]